MAIDACGRHTACISSRCRVRCLANTALMAIGDALLGVWQNGGQVIVIGGAGYALRAVRAAPSAVSTHDRRSAALNRDLRRWIQDRDRQLQQALALITAYANDPDLEGSFVENLIALRKPVPDELKKVPAGSQYYSGAHLRWRADATERALHEYRDRATASLDEFDAIVEPEGRLDRIVRRRRSLDPPRLILSSEERSVLARWREPATVPGLDAEAPVNDVSRPELEPALAALEGH